MCRQIEMNLDNHGFGKPEMVSEIDSLVFADEALLEQRLGDKMSRADRRINTKTAKKSRQALAKNINTSGKRYVWIDSHGKVFDLGEKEYGKKHFSRTIRYQRFGEPIFEEDIPSPIGIVEDVAIPEESNINSTLGEMFPDILKKDVHFEYHEVFKTIEEMKKDIEIIKLELERAELLAKVHEVNWKIRQLNTK